MSHWAGKGLTVKTSMAEVDSRKASGVAEWAAEGCLGLSKAFTSTVDR